MKKLVRRGFTLIEILIVVVILGILAAIVVPNIASSAQDAAFTMARSQLVAVRGQVEMYKLRHSGVVPPASGPEGTDELFVAMTSADGSWAPLLQREPILPMGFTWYWDGSKLTLDYQGTDATVVADAPTW